MNASTNAGGSNGSKIVKQIVVGLSAVILIYFFLGAVELVSSYINRLQGNRTELLPITYSTVNRTFQLTQNPNQRNALLIQPSNNELTGIEFTYSFFLNTPASSYNNTEGLQHIFHKGSPSQFPLLGPGVYMHSNTNILRVYMNTYDTWNNYVDVDNIPIGKWAHIVVVCKASHLEVFVNGNIKSRLGFDLSPPYQNYGDVYAFSQRRFKLDPKNVSSLVKPFNVTGAMNGQFSRLYYFNYALSFSEINSLFNQGPSSTMDSTNGSANAQTYLSDTWWTANFA